MDSTGISGISVNKYLAFGRKLDDEAEQRNQSAICMISKVLCFLYDVFIKVQVAFIIPQLLNEPEVLMHYAPVDDVNILLERFDQYLYNAHSEEKREDITLNYHLSKVIEAMYCNKEFQRFIPRYTMGMTDLSQFVLKQIEDIFGIAELRLQTSARVDLLREKYMLKAYSENEELKETIKVCRAQLYEKEAALQEKIAKKKNDMKMYRQSIENAYNAYKLEVIKTQDETCQQILQIKSSNEDAEDRLREDAERSKATYTQLLLENLRAEKKLREKKQKVLAQLLSLIEKYENDMVEKVLENDNMNDRIAEKKKELEDFIVEYKRQRQEYREVFNITDDDELSPEEKIKNFTMYHAAKVIQRAWKLYQEMKKNKKKKKGKGKKGKAKKATPKKEKQAKEKDEKPAKIFDLEESTIPVEKKPKEKGAKGKKAKVKEKDVEVVTAVNTLEDNESVIAEKETDMAEENAEEEKEKTEVGEEEKVDESQKVENVGSEKQEENVPDQENKDGAEQEQIKDDAAIENQKPPGKGKAGNKKKKK